MVTLVQAFHRHAAMRAKLTKRKLDATPTPRARFRLFDTELPGFLVDLSPSGARTFYVRYRAGTGRAAPIAWVKLGEYGALTVEEARTAARGVLAGVARGENPAQERARERGALTLSALSPAFLADVKARRKPTTAAEYRRMFDRDVVPILGTKRAADLTTADLARLHSSMRDRPYMANRVLAVLGAFCSWCELHGYRPKHSNPAPDVEPYVEHARERFLSGEEMARLGAALTTAETVGVPPAPSRRRKPKKGKTAKHRPRSADKVRPANPFAVACLRFLLLSGWREAEARTLRWDALDAARGHAILVDTKTGRSVRPLGAAVFAFLDELPRLAGSPYVFPSADAGRPIVNLTRTWEAVRLAAQLPDVRLHDLRHTAASVAAAGGLSLPLIGALLGHRNPSTTQKYAHLADDPRRLAADRLAGDMAAALAGTTTNVTPIRQGAR
jgi:integrase